MRGWSCSRFLPFSRVCLNCPHLPEKAIWIIISSTISDTVPEWMLHFLWAGTIWIFYIWRCVKQPPNSGPEASGAAGLEPNAANCNKNVEKLFFFLLMCGFSLHTVLDRWFTKTVTMPQIIIQPQVFRGLSETQSPWVRRHGNKTAPLGWFNPTSQIKSKTKLTELIFSSVVRPLTKQNNSQMTDNRTSFLKDNIQRFIYEQHCQRLTSESACNLFNFWATPTKAF